MQFDEYGDPIDTWFCSPCGLYHGLGECNNPYLQEED